MFRTTFFFYTPQLKSRLHYLYNKVKHISLNELNRRFINSGPVIIDHNKMKIQIIPALEDNYMYLLINECTREIAAIDPVDPDQILCAVKAQNGTLTKILTTHHHWDHAGGNKTLVKSCPDLQVYGGDDRVDGLTCKVSHGSTLKLGDIVINCLHTPCHTCGHICYYVTQDGSEPAVFTGDTLFSGGCGRFFEGSAQDMHKSLNEILANLPDKTRVYCGHDYTMANLQFGLSVEPSNDDMRTKFKWACCRRQNGLPTVPSTIGEEKLINPFMRVCNQIVQQFCRTIDPVDTMRVLRSKKDEFKAK